MVDEIKADKEDARLMIYPIPKQTPFSRYTIWCCHVLSIYTERREASRDREKKKEKKEEKTLTQIDRISIEEIDRISIEEIDRISIEEIDRISIEVNIEISNVKSTYGRISNNFNELLFANDQCLIYEDTQ
jgi:hypothetical protein